MARCVGWLWPKCVLEGGGAEELCEGAVCVGAV